MLVALNRPASVRVEVRDFDGELASPSGSVAVSVSDASASVVATGYATADEVGVYSYALPSSVVGTLGVYQATAVYTLAGFTASAVELVETVGGYLFDVADMRAYDAESLSSSVTYPAHKIREARDNATDRMELSGEVGFTTHRTRQYLDGSGKTTLLLPHVMVQRLVSCQFLDDAGEVTTTLTADELAVVGIDSDAGVLIRDSRWPSGTRNVLVVYDHGYTSAPAAGKRPAILLAVEELVKSALPSRATAQATDLGDFRISLANPDRGKDTGIPDTDAFIQTYGRRRPRIG